MQGAIAALSALALLTACTPSSSDPDAPREHALTAEPAADPVFPLGPIIDETAEEASSPHTDSPPPTDGGTASAAPSDSASSAASLPTGDRSGEAVESGDAIELDAGQRIGV